MRSGLSSIKVKKTIRCGKIYRSGAVSVRYLAGDEYRFSPVVSKKKGNAVKRNRVKRIIRGIMASNKNLYPKGYYLIYFRGQCDTINRAVVESTLDSIVQTISV